LVATLVAHTSATNTAQKVAIFILAAVVGPSSARGVDHSTSRDWIWLSVNAAYCSYVL